MRPSRPLAALALLCSSTALAYSPVPPPPVRDYASANGQSTFRVLNDPSTGSGRGPVRGLLLERGKETPLWTVALEVTPQQALPSDDGGYVATFDEHTQAGRGRGVLVLYGPNGRLVRSCTLEDLLTAEEIQQVAQSKAGRTWRAWGEGVHERFDLAKGELVVPVSLQGRVPPPGPLPATKDLRVSLADGSVVGRPAPRQEAPAVRPRGESDDPTHAEELSVLQDAGAPSEARRQALKTLVKANSAKTDEAIAVALAARDPDLRAMGLLQLEKLPTSAKHFDAVVSLLGDASEDVAQQADELVRDKYLPPAAKQFLPKLEKAALDPNSPASRAPYLLGKLAELEMAENKPAKAVSLLERLAESRVETLEVVPPRPQNAPDYSMYGAPESKRNRKAGKLGVKANAFARLAAIALQAKDVATYEKRLVSLRKAPLAGKVCDPFGAPIFPPCQLIPPSEAERILTERAKK